MSGKFQLKGHSRLAGLESLNVDGEDQYMPGQKRDVTYVSRLQVRNYHTCIYITQVLFKLHVTVLLGCFILYILYSVTLVVEIFDKMLAICQSFTHQIYLDIALYDTLQSVQAAVDHQLSDFAKSQPNTKICLVTFNNEVTVLGDGKNDAVVVTGDKLNDNDALVKVGNEVNLPGSIKDTNESLSSKLFGYVHLYKLIR